MSRLIIGTETGQNFAFVVALASSTIAQLRVRDAAAEDTDPYFSSPVERGHSESTLSLCSCEGWGVVRADYTCRRVCGFSIVYDISSTLLPS